MPRDDLNNLKVNDYELQRALQLIKADYGDTASINEKKKSLLKFGTHTTIGTGWETLAEMQDSEVAETFVTDNGITHVISTQADTQTVTVEGHTIDGDGNTTFVTQNVTLTGTTAKALTTPLFRANRAFNIGSTALTGAVAFYEGGGVTSGKPDNDDQVHLLITAGEQQTQKGATTISSSDYWIVSSFTLSVTEKQSSWAEARIEIKPVAGTYWRPITQNIGCSDSSGTIKADKRPYIIVPKNHDVRIAVRGNAIGTSVAGGFNGYLASIQ